MFLFDGLDDGEAQYKKLLESLHGQRSDIGEQESQGANIEAAKQQVPTQKWRYPKVFFLMLNLFLLNMK